LDTFLEASGATGPLHLTVENTGVTGRYLLPQPFALVGRDARADLRLTGGEVARRHLFMQLLAGRLLCVDLSGSGERQDGRPPFCWLDPGQVVQVGTATIRLANPHAAEAGLVSPWQPSALPSV